MSLCQMIVISEAVAITSEFDAQSVTSFQRRCVLRAFDIVAGLDEDTTERAETLDVFRRWLMPARTMTA